VSATDEFLVESSLVHEFVADVREIVTQGLPAAAACDLIRPRFAELLGAEHWLPDRFQEPAAASGMGGGIGQWLLYRAGDGSLSLFSLVVPPGAQTPVHDHLAWGTSASTAAPRTRRSTRATTGGSTSYSAGRSPPATSTR
jgi:predicted metal-dependent enzyme (double-stranded beta helix superfamily)